MRAFLIMSTRRKLEDFSNQNKTNKVNHKTPEPPSPRAPEPPTHAGIGNNKSSRFTRKRYLKFKSLRTTTRTRRRPHQRQNKTPAIADELLPAQRPQSVAYKMEIRARETVNFTWSCCSVNLRWQWWWRWWWWWWWW